MKLKKMSLISLTMLFVACLLMGCGNSSISIEGTWNVIDQKGNAGSINFQKNNTFIMSSGIMEIGGDYLLEDKELTLTHVNKEPIKYEIEVSDKQSINLYSIDEEGTRTDKETIKMTKQN